MEWIFHALAFSFDGRVHYLQFVLHVNTVQENNSCFGCAICFNHIPLLTRIYLIRQPVATATSREL